jgi:hypothetical protein
MAPQTKHGCIQRAKRMFVGQVFGEPENDHLLFLPTMWTWKQGSGLRELRYPPHIAFFALLLALYPIDLILFRVAKIGHFWN